MSNFNSNPPQAQYHQNLQYVPPPNKPKSKAWMVVVGLVGAFVLGLGIGAAAFSSPATDAAANSEPVATGTTPTPSNAKPTRGPDKPKAKVVKFAGNGTYEVGTAKGEVKPGTYKSNGELCYWARLRAMDGDLLSIITNSVGGGEQRVTIKPTDKGFKTQGCDEWVLVK